VEDEAAPAEARRLVVVVHDSHLYGIFYPTHAIVMMPDDR